MAVLKDSGVASFGDGTDFLDHPGKIRRDRREIRAFSESCKRLYPLGAGILQIA